MTLTRVAVTAVAVLLLASCASRGQGPVSPAQPSGADVSGQTDSADNGPTATPIQTPSPRVSEDLTETAQPVAETFDRCDTLEEPPPAPDGPLSDDPAIAEAQQARAAMALPSDIATVEAMLAAGPGAAGWPMGYPTTDEEFQAIMARNGDDNVIDELQQWAATTYPDTWAGMWLDQSRGGLVTVAFTADVDQRVAEITQRYDLEVRGVEVEHSDADLSAARQVVNAVMQRQREGRVDQGLTPGDVFGMGIRSDTNRLHVDMYTDDPAAQAALADVVDPALVCLDIEEIPTAADAELADWAPAADADLSSASSAVALDVIERACASGGSADGRVVVQDVRYEVDAVVVTIGVVPRPGVNGCPGNPITPFVLNLAEPLDGRQLLDGADEPPSVPALDV